MVAKKPTAKAEAAKAKLDRALALLEKGVAELVETSGEAWTAYLRAASRFSRYSFRNQMLILAQRPTATHVASYNQWIELGYQVREGQGGVNAIHILAPSTRKITEEEAKKAGKPEAAGQSRIIGWRAVSVFDISQTDPTENAQPLAIQPDMPIQLEGASPEGLQTALEEQIRAQGFAFSRGVPSSPGANGTTSWGPRTVVVRDDVSDAQAVKTTAHELAHILCGHEHNGDIRSRQEVEADSVAFVVADHFGLDTSQYTFRYLLNWAGKDAVTVVKETAATVRRVSKQILDGLASPEPVTESAEEVAA